MTLTRKAFLRWLRAQKPGRRFRRLNGCKCPIATYTGERVFVCYYARRDTSWPTVDRNRPLPRWATAFIKLVDGGDGGTDNSITASECIRLLSEGK